MFLCDPKPPHSQDHVCDRADERQRLSAAGCQLIQAGPEGIAGIAGLVFCSMPRPVLLQFWDPGALRMGFGKT